MHRSHASEVALRHESQETSRGVCGGFSFLVITPRVFGSVRADEFLVEGGTLGECRVDSIACHIA